MSYQIGYHLEGSPGPTYDAHEKKNDGMAAISGLNRIAQVACQRIILMMNNTRLLKEKRIVSMDEVLVYLQGFHDDVGLSGDRGDFYRRKLAEQIFATYAVEGVTHCNVMTVVESAIMLERETRKILSNSARSREWAPSINIDDGILNILSRIADLF